jgi:hypothetical protein
MVSPSEESRLRVELEERELEAAAYREELAVVKQQRRSLEDRHELTVLEYQRVVRQQQEDIDRLQHENRTPVPSPSSTFSFFPSLQRSSSSSSSSPSSQREHFEAGSPRAAAASHPSVEEEALQREVAALQRKVEEAEIARREEVAALEGLVQEQRSEVNRAAHAHALVVRRKEDEHEQVLLSMQAQLHSIKQQLREATEKSLEMEAKLAQRPASSPSSSRHPDDDEEAEETLRRVRGEYESEIESLRRELMVTSAKLSQASLNLRPPPPLAHPPRRVGLFCCPVAPPRRWSPPPSSLLCANPTRSSPQS